MFDAVQPLTQENSGTSNDEILKILRAISSQMITGQQDLQLEIQRVRDDHENSNKKYSPNYVPLLLQSLEINLPPFIFQLPPRESIY
jgi:hypothetical protein